MSEAKIDVREELDKIENEDNHEDVNDNLEHNEEPSEIEVMAADSGWKPDKQDKDGNTLSAKEFMDRKPLFNKIRNQGDQIDDLMERVNALQSDNKKITQASMKENERLLEELEAAKDTALTNLDVDDVRKIDKQIDNVKETIADTKDEQIISPLFEDFKKDNAWAADETNPLNRAGEGYAIKYMKEHGDKGNDKEMYEFIHNQIRVDFPEKFEDKPKPQNKVASSRNRSTSNSRNKDRSVMLSDLNAEDQMLFSRMFTQTGKTEAEYMKNYKTSDFDYLK